MHRKPPRNRMERCPGVHKLEISDFNELLPDIAAL